MGNKESILGGKNPAFESVIPLNKLYKNQDHDSKVVKEAILHNQLVPFYKGLNTIEECTKIHKGSSTEECPICFLFYPRTNTTTCCIQQLCTECFIQIKRNPDFDPAVCPYCIQPDFAVCATKGGSQISSDDIRPNWRKLKEISDLEKKKELERIALRNERVVQINYINQMGIMGADVEEFILMEAIRRSLNDQQ